MIFKSVELRKEETEVIAAIAKMHKSLKYNLSTPSRWEGVLRRNTFARAIRGSNSIEGYLVTAEDAIAAAEGDEPLEAGDTTSVQNSLTNRQRLCFTAVLEVVSSPCGCR